jgi:lycopene beta-cyclase
VTGSDYDVAILGGGLAGLSLAVRLVEPPFAGLRVLIVEPRKEYRRDRTWSYWSLRPHPFQAAVEASWDRWVVAVEGRDIICCAPGLRYETIPADAFYRVALARLRGAANIDIRLGASAEATEDGAGVTIRLPDETARAGLAFDTRPSRGMGRHGLTQLFLGQEIETEAAVFDPGAAMLMDFRCPQSGAPHFTYVLPTSPRRALVEDTWFAGAGFQPPDHRAAIRDYMAKRYGVERFNVVFEERGALPMNPAFQARRGRRLISFGAAGGAARPSTGYAFTSIQAQCDMAAADLAAGRMPASPAPRSGLIRYMDNVLLCLLEQRPQVAPRVFAAMFSGCAPRALVRFLNDAAGPSDFVAVAAAMPLALALGAAARLAMGGRQWPQTAAAG